MTKMILVMRHAKSDWSDGVLSDIDRPLNKRGLKDAPMMAIFLKKNKLLPQNILCSPAVRASMTAQAILDADSGIKKTVLPHLYPGEIEMIRTDIAELSDEWNRIMIVSHNPFVSELLSFYASSTPWSMLRMPTAAMAGLLFKTDEWSETLHLHAELGLMVVPRALKSG